MKIANTEHLENIQDGIFGLEMDFLALHWPQEALDQLIVVPPEVANFSQGRQSRVSLLLEWDGHGIYHPFVWKRMGFDRGLRANEAQALHDAILPYQQSLQVAGWNVPAALRSATVDYDQVNHQVYWYEQLIYGGDGEKMLCDPDVADAYKWQMISEVLHTLYQYPSEALSRQYIAGHTVTALPHGVDLKPANIVLQEYTGRLYLINTFGPKRMHGDYSWITYSPKLESLPEENLRAITASREGLVLRFWRLTSEAWQSVESTKASRDSGFIARLCAEFPPVSELDLIRREMADRYPWLDGLYSEVEI